MTANSMEADPGFFSPEVMTGTRDRQVYLMYGQQKMAGTISGPLFPSNGLQLLVAAIGTDVVSGTTAPYTHTVSQANLASQVESVTIEKNVGNFQSLQFAGCRVGKASIKAQATNQPVTVDYDCSASVVAVLDTPTAVSLNLTEQPYNFTECTVSLDGTNRYEASNIQLDIDNGLLETYTMDGHHGPTFLSNVLVHVSGQLDVVWSSFDDATYGDFNKMINGTTGALLLTITHPATAGSAAITLPKVALSKYSNDIKITDVVMSTLNYEAGKDLSTSKTISAVFTNSQATAY